MGACHHAMPPRKGEVPAKRAEGFRLPRAAMVTAALSAAVTSTPKQKNAPTSHGRASPKERTSLFPATLRERGSGGEALLLEKRLSPRISTLFHFLCDVSRYGYAGGAGLHQTAGDAGAVADSVKALDGGHEFVVNKKLAGVEFHLDTVKQRILAV